MSAPSSSQALALWRLLSTGAKLPHGTRHLVCDEALCEHVAVLMRRANAAGVDFDLLAALFVSCPGGPAPVKQAHSIASPAHGWISKMDPSEWRGALVRWGAKHGRFPDGVMAAGDERSRGRKRGEGWSDEDECERDSILRGMGVAS